VVSISLIKRDITAFCTTTCTAFGLDTQICYRGSFDARTQVQRTIEQFIVPPHSACRVLVGGLEFYYEDGQHLSGISLYCDFGRVKKTDLRINRAVTDPVWLNFPAAAGSERDVVNYPASIAVWQDRANNTIRIVLADAKPCDLHELAENLWVGRTPAGDIGEIWFFGVIWA